MQTVEALAHVGGRGAKVHPHAGRQMYHAFSRRMFSTVHKVKASMHGAMRSRSPRAGSNSIGAWSVLEWPHRLTSRKPALLLLPDQSSHLPRWLSSFPLSDLPSSYARGVHEVLTEIGAPVIQNRAPLASASQFPASLNVGLRHSAMKADAVPNSRHKRRLSQNRSAQGLPARTGRVHADAARRKSHATGSARVSARHRT